MRVTNGMMLNMALSHIQQQSQRLFETQEDVSSGKRVHRPSDDPISTRRILDLRRSLASLEQFKSNRGTMESLLQATDAALNNVGDILVRAKELAIAGSNSSAGASDREFIRKEVAQLFDHLVELGNTDVGGRFIFAGQANDQPPFARLVATESTSSGLISSGTIRIMSSGDLQINGTAIRQPTAADDLVSTSDRTASALAIATAINDSTATTGVSAAASTTLALSVTSFGNLTGTDFLINGTAVTGTISDIASLVTAVNTAQVPGVSAFSTENNTLILRAEDGRNIQLQTTGTSAGGMAFDSFDLGGGAALDRTTSGIVTLTSDTTFTVSGANPGNAGFSPQTVERAVGRYSGGSGQIDLEISSGQRMAVNILGSQFLVADLRPNLDATTPLEYLRQGQGIRQGSIQITDRAGNSATVDLSTARTIDDLLTAISGTSGINVTASINAAGNGLNITDDNPNPSGNLTITEVGGGQVASDLGIVASRPGDLLGAPLEPILSETTPLALLHEGKGVIPETIHITNGTLEADVDLNAAQTIGEVLTRINNSGLNVTARINVSGTALDVRSNDSSTVATVTEVGSGTTASALGIQGSNDILKTLSLLQESLAQNDQEALDDLLLHLDAALDQTLSLRGDVGARLNRVELTNNRSAALEFTATSLLSQSEDADMFQAISRLSSFRTALEAALAATANTTQLSLLDFLR